MYLIIISARFVFIRSMLVVLGEKKRDMDNIRGTKELKMYEGQKDEQQY